MLLGEDSLVLRNCSLFTSYLIIKNNFKIKKIVQLIKREFIRKFVDNDSIIFLYYKTLINI